jgi:hypothetical protein
LNYCQHCRRAASRTWKVPEKKGLLRNEDFGNYIQHLHEKVVKFSDLENYKDIYQLLPE